MYYQPRLPHREMGRVQDAQRHRRRRRRRSRRLRRLGLRGAAARPPAALPGAGRQFRLHRRSRRPRDGARRRRVHRPDGRRDQEANAVARLHAPTRSALNRSPINLERPIMPIRIPDNLPARKTLEAEGVDGHGFDPRRAAGHPPAADRPAQPDAQQGAHRDAVHPADRRDAAAGRPDAGAHHRPPDARTPPRTTSRPSTRPGTRCGSRSSTASSSPARRSPTSRSRRCATGTRWSRSWTGRRPTCTTPCSSAGARRRRCTTSTARKRYRMPTEGLRRVPPQDRQPALALAARLFRQPDDPGVALQRHRPRDARRRTSKS